MFDHFLDPVEPTPQITACRSTSHLSHRERDDAYTGTIVQFSPRWRLILCKDQVQWILQKKESSHQGFWRSKHYLTCKDSVLEASGRLGLLSDAKAEAVLNALPTRTGNYRKK
jgi:hypothetical protein